MGGVRLDGDTQRPADGAISVLIDVRTEKPIAIIREIGIARTAVVNDVGGRCGKLRILVIQRTHRAQVYRTGNADSGQTRISRLVDDALPDQL